MRDLLITSIDAIDQYWETLSRWSIRWLSKATSRLSAKGGLLWHKIVVLLAALLVIALVSSLTKIILPDATLDKEPWLRHSFLLHLLLIALFSLGEIKLRGLKMCWQSWEQLGVFRCYAWGYQLEILIITLAWLVSDQQDWSTLAHDLVVTLLMVWFLFVLADLFDSSGNTRRRRARAKKKAHWMELIRQRLASIAPQPA